MMLSDLSSDHEATGSSSHGGDIASYALSPLFLAPAPPLAGAAAPQTEAPRVGAKRKRSQPGNPGITIEDHASFLHIIHSRSFLWFR